jgi:thioredoxin 1
LGSVRAQVNLNDDGVNPHQEESTMSDTMAVTDANFASEIEQASGLAVVDFWAAWCGPCKMVGPIVDQLATEYAGKAKVTKLDVDSNQKTAMKYNVRSIPTILFFKDGKVVDTVIGFAPKPALEQKFKQHTAN